jgi:hypothetical protein
MTHRRRQRNCNNVTRADWYGGAYRMGTGGSLKGLAAELQADWQQSQPETTDGIEPDAPEMQAELGSSALQGPNVIALEVPEPSAEEPE